MEKLLNRPRNQGTRGKNHGKTIGKASFDARLLEQLHPRQAAGTPTVALTVHVLHEAPGAARIVVLTRSDLEKWKIFTEFRCFRWFYVNYHGFPRLLGTFEVFFSDL